MDDKTYGILMIVSILLQGLFIWGLIFWVFRDTIRSLGRNEKTLKKPEDRDD